MNDPNATYSKYNQSPDDEHQNDNLDNSIRFNSDRRKFVSNNNTVPLAQKLVQQNVHPYGAYNGGDKVVIEKSPDNSFWKKQNRITENPAFIPQYPTRPPSNPFPTYTDNNSKQSLSQFVNKTLNYVFAQLCVTTAVTTGMYLHKDSVNNYIISNPSIIWLPIILTFGTLLGMFCCSSKESLPIKKTLFCIFTIACSGMVGMSAIQYAPNVIISSSVTLLVIVGFINAYAYNSAIRGKDFTYCGPCLFGFLIIVITLSIVNIFVHSTFLQLCIAGLSVIVFTALLLYDLNRLYNGSEMNEFERPEPLIAAINIYLDIINIFLNLLQIFNGSSSD